VAQGRLSELAGAGMLNMDKYMKVMSLHDRAKKVVAKYDLKEEEIQLF
jgi:acyl-homoserine lactone acylase PvdQ